MVRASTLPDAKHGQPSQTRAGLPDPLPAGSTALGSGLGGDSRIATQGERRVGNVWPAFEERTVSAFRASTRWPARFFSAGLEIFTAESVSAKSEA